MWNKCGCQQQYQQIMPAYDYCAPSYVSPAYYRGKCKYNGNMFVLLVVLFILLIIVGACKW
ncbi:MULTISPECIES: YjcZ family sporulation protein [Ureibacillus]|jgi:uncharacterized protein (TIGR01732 family)|uniref:Uncharacterized protein (TIGR01732 family) n=1 Tax=Ureibacillus thermosphaericus TaxID=51173 RepID=A0A840PTM9_URETH|nr:uncharacterized protein (TIGR01732 family) [Ureibacillus thermosphaericus]